MSDPAAPAEVDDLRARLAQLEAENERLRARPGATAAAGDASPERARAGSRWRAVLSALCVVIATILVPVSIVAAWARVELVDEARFVETFAPLADDPDVQLLVADQVTTAIEEGIELDTITNDLFDGLQSLDLPPRALAAIDLLREPAVQGLHGLVDSTVTKLVASDAFANVWETALRTSHRSLAAVASGGTEGGAVVISSAGEVGIELAPIIEEVKTRLSEQGVGFADSIPPINRTIVVAQADALTLVATVYNLAVAAGWWMPLVALALFLTGILTARRRSTALIGMGAGIAIGAGVLAIGLDVGGSVLALSAPNLGVSSDALAAIYEQVTGAMRDTAIVFLVVGVILAVIGWLSGRWRGAQATRSGVASVTSGLRQSVRARGLETHSFGTWMYHQRVLVRVILAVTAVVWLLLLRPLSIGDVFLVLVVWLVVWWIAELLQARPDEEPIETAGDGVPVDAETVPLDDAIVSPDAETVPLDDAVIDTSTPTKR